MTVQQPQHGEPSQPADGPAQIPECDHHWISAHQPDFPPAVYWVRYCSICHRIDGSDLTEQVDRLVAELAAAQNRADNLTALSRDPSWLRAKLRAATPRTSTRLHTFDPDESGRCTVCRQTVDRGAHRPTDEQSATGATAILEQAEATE